MTNASILDDDVLSDDDRAMLSIAGIASDERKNEIRILKADPVDFENAGLFNSNWSILSELTDDQVNACYDWIEEVPAEGGDESDKEARVEWRAAAPKFIRFTGATSPATADTPERDVIEFVLPESMEKKLKRLETWKRRIEEAESSVRDQAAEVLGLQSKVDEAKGELKAAKERWEQLVCVMQQVITDARSGQQSLPFPEDFQASSPDDALANPGTAGTAVHVTPGPVIPLNVLLVKNIRATVGDDAFESAKNGDDPIGLSQTQLDKLETACESSTLGGLEKWISNDRWWHEKVPGFGDKAVNRLISTIAAYRRVNPMVVAD